VRVLLSLISVYVIQLLKVKPEVTPHVIAQGMQTFHNSLNTFFSFFVMFQQ
jgi:hypothetical protein